jgi:hypothetical protein
MTVVIKDLKVSGLVPAGQAYRTGMLKNLTPIS